MKKLSLIPLIVMSLVVPPSWGETLNDLVKRDGIFYKKFSDVPFTGEFKSRFEHGWIEAGKREGQWVTYFKNGQVWIKGSFKNGNWDGQWVDYHENGQLFREGNYENGRKNGLWVSYDKSGLLRSRGEFKNGRKVFGFITVGMEMFSKT